jgi:hypothetical protein
VPQKVKLAIIRILCAFPVLPNNEKIGLVGGSSEILIKIPKKRGEKEGKLRTATP